MKKEIFVLNIDNYQPELCSKTLPSIQTYADKIGAKLTIIKDRKFPDLSPTYEKLQIHELGKDNDFNVLIDADIEIVPTMYDVTRLVSNGEVGIWMVYDPKLVIEYDEYLMGGKAIATSFMVTTSSIHNLVWKPLEFNIEEIKKRVKRLFVVDEYAISRNIEQHKIPTTSIILPGAEKHFIHYNIGSPNSVQISNKITLVQIGAYIGNKQVDTLFEQNRIEKAILIEPVRWYFNKLVNRYSDHRGVLFENIAIDIVDGERDFYAIEDIDHGNKFINQMSSFKESFVTDHGLDIRTKKIKVKCLSIKSLYLKYNLKSIDLLLMDTEGYDLNLLEHFPFDVVKPKEIIFEHKHLDKVFDNKTGLAKIFDHLAGFGYVCSIIDNENASARLI